MSDGVRTRKRHGISGSKLLRQQLIGLQQMQEQKKKPCAISC